MNVLNKDIKEKTFKRVYLLYGNEDYLRKQYRDRLKDAVVPDGNEMNEAYFFGKDTDEKQIMELADTVPFFADMRIIIAEETGFFKSGGHDALAGYMKSIPETSCIVFSESKADKRSKMFKAVSEQGYAADLSTPDDRQLFAWLAGMVKRSGKEISRPALNHFMDLVEHDMNSMQHEMEKLISYAGDRTEITSGDVDGICSARLENRIFDMVHAASGKNFDRAMKIYDDLINLKTPPLLILHLLTDEFEEICKVRELSEKGYSRAVIAQRTGMRDFVVKQDILAGENFRLSVLYEAVEDGTALEEAVKTGRLNENIAAEMMISKYSRNPEPNLYRQ